MGFWSKLLGTEARKPHQLDVLVHEAFGGAIRVFEVPTAQGWQYVEDQRRGDDFTVMVLRYGLPMQPMPLTLIAKIYTLEGRAPEDPQSTDWRAVFGGLFSNLSNVSVQKSSQLTMKSSLEAVEAVIDGVAADPPAPLRIRERRAVAGNEQFIVGALGSPTAFDEHAAEIERWFSMATFVPMQDSATP
jgi:hypothetical protein